MCFAEMTVCRFCSAEVPQVRDNSGRRKVYCNDKCRYNWRKLQGTLTPNTRPAEIAEGCTLPALEELRQEFSYDPETGVITRLKNKGKHLAGDPAGCVDSLGYVTILYKRKSIKAHRLAWYLHTGVDPKELQIDHIDRKRDNNKFSNLRLATPTENNLNKQPDKSCKGVYQNKVSGYYYAQISLNGKNKHLGCYKTYEEAVEARKKAVLEHYNTGFVLEHYL